MSVNFAELKFYCRVTADPSPVKLTTQAISKTYGVYVQYNVVAKLPVKFFFFKCSAQPASYISLQKENAGVIEDKSRTM